MEIEETNALAVDLVKRLVAAKTNGNNDKATLVGLFGDLGAGKTTFTKAAAEALGIKETVSSPTFVIEKIYKTPGPFSHLIHIDAYRLESGSELLRLGFQEMMDDPKNLIFIEWPEKVADILGEGMIKIHFKFTDEKRREITIENF